MCDTCDSKNAKIPRRARTRARVRRRIIGIFTLSFSVELPYRLDKSQGVRDRDSIRALKGKRSLVSKQIGITC